jgi:alpha-tubulin suppressor-like RCC1 family protein
MIKKYNHILIFVLFLLIAINVSAQVPCSGTASISPNGTITINGVTVTSVSTRAVVQYAPAFSGCASLSPNSLLVGKHVTASDGTPAPWSITLTFDKPVNDLVLLLAGGGRISTGYNENFIFNGNNGPISTSSSEYCNASTAGNVIDLWSAGSQEGGGKFKVHSTRPFTQLVINGSGGANGSYLGICSESINAVPPKCFISNANSTTGWKAKVYDAPDMNAWAQISVSNGFPTSSYTQIATFDYNENANSSNAFDVFFSTNTYGLIPANPQIKNYVGTQIPYDSNGDYAVLFSKTIATGEEGAYQFDLGYADDHIFIYKNGVKLKQQQNAYNVTPLDNFAIMNVVVGDVISILVVEEYDFNTEVQMMATKLIVPPVKNVANVCPWNTVNLNDAYTGSIPAGTSLVWFTNSAHTGTALSGTQVSDAGAGTYYAFYYNGTCYSAASNPVVLTINNCPPVNNCVTGDCNDNTFLNTSNPNTIEYDNFMSGFHSSIIKQNNGNYIVWGQNARPDGVITNGYANLYEPTEITPANGFNYTGKVLKAAIGTQGVTGKSYSDQYALLTEDGLYIWGGGATAAVDGTMVSNTVKTDNVFARVSDATIGNANSYGLPVGVNPQDVKMMFGSFATLAITTCTGQAWVLSWRGNKNGDGTNDSTPTNRSSWHRVMKTADAPLTGVVAMRGTVGALMALTSNGELYTWGTETYLGDGSNKVDRLYATKMAVPTGVTPKMIGMTKASGSVLSTMNSYYLLSTMGELYSLGDNSKKQLGTFDAVEQKSWIHVKSKDASSNMTDIVWISSNEHDNAGHAAVTALTASGKLWGWGMNNGNMLGTGSNGTVDPRFMLGGLSDDDKILAIETGGHINTLFKDCDYKLGYIGHNSNGSYATVSNNTGSFSTDFKFDGVKMSNLCAINLPAYPKVKDLEICKGHTTDLKDALENAVPLDYVLQWWTTPNRTAGTLVEDPTKVTKGTYYGFFVSADHDCPNLVGEKVNVTENPVPVVPQDLANITTFVNNDGQFTVNMSGYASYVWEYAITATPTVWNTLDNSTYNGMVILTGTTFQISHATMAIDSLRIRLKAVSDKGCETYSNEVLIKVASGIIITNPMMINQAKR